MDQFEGVRAQLIQAALDCAKDDVLQLNQKWIHNQVLEESARQFLDAIPGCFVEWRRDGALQLSRFDTIESAIAYARALNSSEGIAKVERVLDKSGRDVWPNEKL